MTPLFGASASERSTAFWFTALIAVAVFRVLQIAPDWASGTAPAYPGQYEGRVLSSITIVGIMGATLISEAAKRTTMRGRIGYWALLAVAMLSLAVQASKGY